MTVNSKGLYSISKENDLSKQLPFIVLYSNTVEFLAEEKSLSDLCVVVIHFLRGYRCLVTVAVFKDTDVTVL